jgi:LmbE family N-acetylglucosaminyl deacetylase
MNVLVIAPHPDDESIGCGGALCLHARRGDRITVVYLTSGELGLKHLPRRDACVLRECEAARAAKILGVAGTVFLRLADWFVSDAVEKGAAKLGPILKRVKPALIYLPHEQEWHPDHKAALPMLRTALEQSRTVVTPSVRAYEIWTPLPAYDHVEDISAVMPRKLRALRAHKSQLKEFDYVRAVSGLNQFRGALSARRPFAEVFQVIELKPGQ